MEILACRAVAYPAVLPAETPSWSMVICVPLTSTPCCAGSELHAPNTGPQPNPYSAVATQSSQPGGAPVLISHFVASTQKFVLLRTLGWWHYDAARPAQPRLQAQAPQVTAASGERDQNSTAVRNNARVASLYE